MTDRYFTKGEAEALRGIQIRTTVEFSGVPKGTAGTVARADQSSRDGYTVAIQWDLPGRDRPLVDWFGKAEFERYLERL